MNGILLPGMETIYHQCRVPSCQRPIRCRGLCAGCYAAYRRRPDSPKAQAAAYAILPPGPTAARHISPDNSAFNAQLTAAGSVDNLVAQIRSKLRTRAPDA